MYRALNENSVFAPRLYRTPEEIKDDINEVKDRIENINEALNIRELIDGCIEGENIGPDECERVSELLTSAIDALSELRSLGLMLDELKAELLEVLSL